MLRKETEAKSNHDIPQIDRKFIGKIISDYHALKAEEAKNRIIPYLMPTSPTMRLLENFYQNQKNMINLSGGILSTDECFDLIKILFKSDSRDGEKTKNVIYVLLTKYVKQEIIAALALASAVNRVDVLANHFEVMCKNPEYAASIAYAVLILADIIAIAKNQQQQAEFSEKLSEEIIENPQVAVAFIDVMKKILNQAPDDKHRFLGTPDIVNLLKNDAKVYLLVKLQLAKLMTPEIMQRLNTVSFYQMIQIARNSSFNQNSAKGFIEKYLKTNTTFSRSNFSQFAQNNKPVEEANKSVGKVLSLS